MPGGWSKPRDVAKLADTRAEFDYAIPCEELSGLRKGFTGCGVPLRMQAVFGRLQGLPVAELALHGELGAVCQRCLTPMRLQVTSRSRVAVVTTAAAGDVPESCETYLADDGHVSLLALAEEELLLALPLVPRHETGEQCSGAAVVPVPTQAAASSTNDTQRPFADLRSLLEADERARRS